MSAKKKPEAQQAAEQKELQTWNLTLSTRDLNVVLASLGKQPAEQTFETLVNIREQLNAKKSGGGA